MKAGDKKFKIVETTKGEIKSEAHLSSFKIVLFHEILSPVVLPMACNFPLNLETLPYHL